MNKTWNKDHYDIIETLTDSDGNEVTAVVKCLMGENNMRLLLVSGVEVLIDDDVYEWAKDEKWFFDHKGRVRNTHKVYLHQLVLKEKKGFVIDHIDGNPLNNQISNLRHATVAENNRNRKMHKNNTTGYKGVSFSNGKFVVKVQGKTFGYFDNAEDAARKYDEKSKELFGEFAKTNF